MKKPMDITAEVQALVKKIPQGVPPEEWVTVIEPGYTVYYYSEIAEEGSGTIHTLTVEFDGETAQ
jgi:hypothetical protein